MKTNKLRLYALSILLILIVTATSALISAWLFDEKQTSHSIFTLGEVSYSLTGELVDNLLIVPGLELIETPYVLTNNSTISTEIRVYLLVHSQLLNGNVNNYLEIDMDAGWQQDLDGYWYYRGNDTVNEDGKHKVLPSTSTINFLNSLKLDGYQVKNPFAHDIITITIVFQMKQANFVTWQTLGSLDINFNTGVPND